MDAAIIMPVYGQGPLLCESITSALEQETDYDYRIILVDDNCPQAETVDNCRRFSRQNPDKILYWRSPVNRGLAAMRNEGVALALQQWPDVKGILFLDGDDRLHSKMLDRAVTELYKASAQKSGKKSNIGWIYEDPDHYGIDGVSVRPHTFSKLFFMAGCANTSSSIINSNMFRDGLRYREDFQTGGEDWQFWINCIDHGYEGKFVSNIGFRYRLKSGSMSAGAAQVADNNRAKIRASLPDIFNPETFLRLEQNETPRHLAMLGGNGHEFDTNGNFSEKSISLPVLASMLAQYDAEPTTPIPQFLYFASPETFSALRKARALDWTLTRLERMAGKQKIVNARLQPPKNSHNAVEVDTDGAFSTTSKHAELICLSSKVAADLFVGRTSVEQLQNNKKVVQANFRFRNVTAESATAEFNRFVEQGKQLLTNKKYNFRKQPSTKWKPFGVERYDMGEHFFGASPVLARPSAKDEILLIIREQDLQTAELEQATISMAKELKKRKQKVSLLVLGSSINQNCARHFDNLFVLRQKIVNHKVVTEAGEPVLLGLMLPFGTIITMGCASIAPELNQLRLYGRNVLGVLPTRASGATQMHEELIHCFKIFKGLYCMSEMEMAKAEALGVAPEQIIPNISQLLDRATGKEAIPE